MHIQLAELDDLEQILKVLNEATLDLHKKGVQQWDYPWDENIILDQIKTNCSYVLLVENKIVGTFCIKDIDNINDLSVEVKSKYLFQIAVLPDFQGNNLGSEITEFACNFVKKINKTLYLDCWAGNEKLKQFYSRNGFEYIGDYPEENYFISIFKYN